MMVRLSEPDNQHCLESGWSCGPTDQDLTDLLGRKTSRAELDGSWPGPFPLSLADFQIRPAMGARGVSRGDGLGDVGLGHAFVCKTI